MEYLYLILIILKWNTDILNKIFKMVLIFKLCLNYVIINNMLVDNTKCFKNLLIIFQLINMNN